MGKRKKINESLIAICHEIISDDSGQCATAVLSRFSPYRSELVLKAIENLSLKGNKQGSIRARTMVALAFILMKSGKKSGGSYVVMDIPGSEFSKALCDPFTGKESPRLIVDGYFNSFVSSGFVKIERPEDFHDCMTYIIERKRGGKK